MMDAKRALNLIAAQCSKKEYCRVDVEQKLRRWELTEEEIEECMAFLTKHRFVDDARFAAAYVQDKFRFRRWGKRKIEQMLRQKGLPASVIANALDLLVDETYDETCIALLQQKNRSLHETDPYRRKAKLFRFALSRGFDGEVIQRCLDRVLT